MYHAYTSVKLVLLIISAFVVACASLTFSANLLCGSVFYRLL